MSLLGRIRRAVFGWLTEPKSKPTPKREPKRSRKRAPKPAPKPKDEMPEGWQIEGFMPGNDGTSNLQWPQFEPYDPDGPDAGWGPGWINTQTMGARIIVSRTNPDGSKDYGTIHGPIRDKAQAIDIINRQPNVTVSPK